MTILGRTRTALAMLPDSTFADNRHLQIEVPVREHHAGLRAHVRSLGVEDAWVGDVAQETFLIAYRKMDQWDLDRCAGRWLRGIARHLVANDRRKDARRSRLLAAGLADLLSQAEPDRCSVGMGSSSRPAMRPCRGHRNFSQREPTNQ